MILGRIARRTTTTTASALAAGLAAALMLSACHGQHDASPPPPTFATPTAITGNATDSPTSGTNPTNPGDIPAAARANTAAGAEAFARLYFTRLNEALVSPPQARLDGLATRQCESCAKLNRNIRLFGMAHERLSEAPYSVGEFVELPESTHRARAFQFVLVQRRTHVLDSLGKPGRVQPAERHVAEILLEHSAGQWSTADLALSTVSRDRTR